MKTGNHLFLEQNLSDLNHRRLEWNNDTIL